MVGMVPDVMVHTSDMPVDEGGGGRNKKVSIIGVLANKPEPTVDNDGMDTMSMVEMIVRMMCYSLDDPLGS